MRNWQSPRGSQLPVCPSTAHNRASTLDLGSTDDEESQLSERAMLAVRKKRRRFNNRKIKGLSVVELQADEIKTILGSKEAPIWVFAVIDVWSRLINGSRQTKLPKYCRSRHLFSRMNLEQIPLVEDGFG